MLAEKVEEECCALFLARAHKHFLEKAQTARKYHLPPTAMFSKPISAFNIISHRLESGGSSNPTASDSYGDRASARARREAREARLATLTSRVEEDSNRDYKKVGSFFSLPVPRVQHINLSAFSPVRKNECSSE